MGIKPFFEGFIPFSNFSTYVDYERLSNPLYLFYRSKFPKCRMLYWSISWRTIWTTKSSLLKSRNVIQIFLDIVTHYKNEFWQMDVKAAFLNGNLTEEVYRHNLKGLHPKIAIKYAYFRNPFLDWSKHTRAGTSVLMKRIGNLTS